MALIDDHHAETAQVWQFILHIADAVDFTDEVIIVQVVAPHGDEVFGAEHECFRAVVILHDACHGRRHQRLAEADDIAD